MTRLDQIDTNLLVALDVLLEERHVTRAARRLAVTQSAMSQTLKRLRETFEDPLLVRSGSGMVPTPRASAIRGPLRDALRALEDTLNAVDHFEPSLAHRQFTFSCLDVYGLSLVPALIRLVESAGPELSLTVANLEVGRVFEQLQVAEIELALIAPWDPPSDISTTLLFQEQMVSMVREDHPLLDGPMTAERYTSWPHVVFRLTGRGDYPIDRRLAELGVKRRIVGHTAHFLSAPALVEDSDMIVTVPRSAACAFARRWPVEIFVPPFEPLTFDVRLAWPRFFDADPAHIWLRERVLEIGAQMASGFEGCTI